MKRLLLFLMFTITVCSSFSQKIRFTDVTNQWIAGHTYFDGTTFLLHQYSGTTVVNGLEYRNLNGQLGYNYLVREDTIEGRVHYRELQAGQQPLDTNEYVAYDYNWRVGDTVVRNVRLPSGKVSASYLVDNVDSVLIQNTFHKVWKFTVLSGSGFGSVPVIEGVGSVAGPTWLFNVPSSFDGGMALYCFTTNNTRPPISLLVSSNTHSCLTAIDENLGFDSKQMAFPNPVTTSSYLKVGDIKAANLAIWNVFGQEVHRRTLTGKTNVPIGELIVSPGIYFYQVADYSAIPEKHYRGSFVRE